MRRPRILVTQFVHEPGLSKVREFGDAVVYADDRPISRELLLCELPTVDGVLTHPSVRFDADALAHAPRLRVISNIAVGYDNIDVDAATARGIAVCNTPGTLDDTTADLTMALLLAVARRIPEADRFVRAGRWQHWTPNLMVGGDVTGATLGIVGLGRIGQAVAVRARAFRMRILYHNRRRRPDLEQLLGVVYADLPTLLRESDFVSLHVPLNAETRHLVGAAELALMKPSAYLLNTARGAVVDQQALVTALRERRIAGAALDVFDPEPLAPDDPLLALDNCVLAPHIGAASQGTRARMAAMAADNLIAVLSGRRPAAIVNPEVLG